MKKKVSTLTLTLSFFLVHANITLQSPKPASGWYKYSNTHFPSRKEWVDTFVLDCEQYKAQNSVIPAHIPNNSNVRIASYNIHFWCKPNISPFHYPTKTKRYTTQDIESNFYNVISAIKEVNADIICLQEVLIFDEDLIKKELQNLGYNYTCFFNEANWAGSLLCIAIASKYPFEELPYGKTFDAEAAPIAHPFEKHCFLKATVSLPHNKKVTLYTSHFDCFDDSETMRYEEVKEVIKHAELDSPSSSYLICGDFNAVRSSDLQYTIKEHSAWELLNRDNIRRTNIPTQTKALELFAAHGFSDCFSAGKIEMPRFSVWNGTVVDFIFLNKHWSLPISGCYFYYTAASDHLPVIFDISV